MFDTPTSKQYFSFIQVQDDLPAVCSILAQEPIIAFDLEFDRDRHTYGFHLCLIQIATPHHCYIIDPISIADLTELYGLFENPALKKLVHCPGEDLRLLHSLNCFPKNMADTEVIAKLLNYEQTSLAKLLENKCEVVLNKKLQQSNWHSRPLSNDQLVYAADDVIYLHQLFKILMEEAGEEKITHWVLEEFDWLQKNIYTLERKTQFLKPGDYKALSPREQYILHAFYVWRDQVAERKNKPAYMIMPDDMVRQLASGELSNSKLLSHSRLHPSLKHGNAAKEMIYHFQSIFTEAHRLNLDSNLVRETFSEAKKNQYYAQKNKQASLKETFFTPIQKQLVNKLGECTARFILSNAWINRWLQGEVRWKDLQPAYKRRIIESIAQELDLPFGEIEQYETDWFEQ